MAVNSFEPTAGDWRRSGRDERGLELRGRLLLVLAVVCRLALAPVEPVRRAEHQRARAGARPRGVSRSCAEGGRARCGSSPGLPRRRPRRRSPRPRSAARRRPVAPLRRRSTSGGSAGRRRAARRTGSAVRPRPGGAPGRRSRMTSPRTETGWPHTRHEGPLAGPGRVSSAVSCCRVCSHWSPQTLRSTSTTSSKATATLLSR